MKCGLPADLIQNELLAVHLHLSLGRFSNRWNPLNLVISAPEETWSRKAPNLGNSGNDWGNRDWERPSELSLELP